MALVIPDEAREPLAQLAQFGREQREQLLAALGAASPALSPPQFVGRLPKIEGLSRRRLLPLVITIMSLYHLKEQTERSADEVAVDVVAALRDENIAGLGDDPVAANEFERFISGLLNFEQSLGVTAKATEIAIEHENNFGAARVITDLRPIFLGKNEPEPRAVTVVHTLKIELHESEDAFYFALDNVDLVTLQDALQRAAQQQDALKQMAEASGLTWIER
jgi:hypothetical protein